MAEIAVIRRNFGMVMTSEVSVAISGINLVMEKATQPHMMVAKTIRAVACQ